MVRVSAPRGLFVLILAFSFFLPAIAVAGKGPGRSKKPGEVTNPADFVELRIQEKGKPGGNLPKQFVPKFYTEEVLRLKKEMEKSEVPEAFQGIGEKAGAEWDRDLAPGKFFDFLPLTPAPSLATQFPGISDTGWIPPDPILAVGPRQVVAMVNSSWAVYGKDGTRLFEETFEKWFDNVYPGTPGNTRIFDPKCTYDPWGKRFILLALARDYYTNDSWYLISVSQKADAMGLWWNYKLDARKSANRVRENWADYPQIGFDSSPDGAVYITSNQFGFDGYFRYAKIRILKKSELYTGAPLSWYDFWNPNVFTWQPAQTLSITNGEWLVNTQNPASGNTVSLWHLTNPTAPEPILQRTAGVRVRPYTAPPDARQKGGKKRIDTGDCRLYNAIFQNNYIYTATTEKWNFDQGAAESAIRYFKIHTVKSEAGIDATYGGPDLFYYFPAIGVDRSGNIHMVFSRSGKEEYACVRYAARKKGDPELGASEVLKAGEAYYESLDSSGRNRWGDYSGIARDPSTGYMWLYGEYAKSLEEWGTWIGMVKGL